MSLLGKRERDEALEDAAPEVAPAEPMDTTDAPPPEAAEPNSEAPAPAADAEASAAADAADAAEPMDVGGDNGDKAAEGDDAAAAKPPTDENAAGGSGNGAAGEGQEDKDGAAPAAGAGDDAGDMDAELFDQLAGIEAEFTKLKDHLFAAKFREVSAQIGQVHDGLHEDFLAQITKFEEQRSQRVAAAERWRQHQLDNINAEYQAEIAMARNEFESEQAGMKDRLLQILNERLRKLEDDRNNTTLVEANNADARQMMRKLRRRQYESGPAQAPARRKPGAPQPFQVSLKENEIMDDLADMSAGIAFMSKAVAGQTTTKVDIDAAGDTLSYNDTVLYLDHTVKVQLHTKAKPASEPYTIVGINVDSVDLEANGAKLRATLDQLRSGMIRLIC